MRSTYYPGVCTKPGTYHQGWFMFMRYTQGQNKGYVLSRSMHFPQVCAVNYTVYLLSYFPNFKVMFGSLHLFMARF